MLRKIQVLVFVIILAWITQTKGDTDVADTTAITDEPTTLHTADQTSTEQKTDDLISATIDSVSQEIADVNSAEDDTQTKDRTEINVSTKKDVEEISEEETSTEQKTEIIKFPKEKLTDPLFMSLASLFPDGIPTQEAPVYPGDPDDHFSALPPVYNVLPVQTPSFPTLGQRNTATSKPTTLAEQSYVRNKLVSTTFITNVRHESTPTSKGERTQTAYARPVTTSGMTRKTPKLSTTPGHYDETAISNEIVNIRDAAQTAVYATKSSSATSNVRSITPNKFRRPTTQQVTRFTFPKFTKSQQPYFGHKISKEIAPDSTTRPIKTDKTTAGYIVHNEINQGKKSRYPTSKKPTVKWINIAPTRPMTKTSKYYMNTYRPSKKKVTNRVSHRNRYRSSTKIASITRATTHEPTLSTRRTNLVNSHHQQNTRPPRQTTTVYEVNTGREPSNLHEKPNFEIFMNTQKPYTRRIPTIKPYREPDYTPPKHNPVLMSHFKPNIPPVNQYLFSTTHNKQQTNFKPSPNQRPSFLQNTANIHSTNKPVNYPNSFMPLDVHTTTSQDEPEEEQGYKPQTIAPENIEDKPPFSAYNGELVRAPQGHSSPAPSHFPPNEDGSHHTPEEIDMSEEHQPISEEPPYYYLPVTKKPSFYLYPAEHEPVQKYQPSTKRAEYYQVQTNKPVQNYRPLVPSNQSNKKDYATSFVISINTFRKPY